MDQELSQFAGYIGTGIGSIVLYIFSKNERLREGITDVLLKRMNKTKIKKIPLESHKVFAMLSKSQSDLTFFVMHNPVKIAFYKEYVKILFSSLSTACTEICNEVESKRFTVEELETLINITLNNSISEIDKQIEASLIIPESIAVQFEQWRAMLLNSFRAIITGVLNDELVDSTYFATYRVFDAITTYCNFVLNSGALEFQRMNGAFDNLTLNDILKS
jgi:hypothetical protein